MRTACLFVFAIYLANVCGQEDPPLPSAELQAAAYDSQHPLKRVVRQDMPKPPDFDGMTPPPNMPEYPQSINRKRREARGIGGSMPTRKG